MLTPAEVDERTETPPVVPAVTHPVAPPPPAARPVDVPLLTSLTAPARRRGLRLSTLQCLGIAVGLLAVAAALGQIKGLNTIAILLGVAGAVAFLISTLVAFLRALSGIAALVRNENDRGIPTARVALAGFSQGGAMALHVGIRYPEALAGLVALSCYLPAARELDQERSAANRGTRIYMAHGTQDPVVPFAMGDESRRLLEASGYAVEWHAFPMPHSLCEPEVAGIRAFLKSIA